MSSPINSYIESISSAAFNIAPERDEELNQINQLYKYKLVLSSETGFGIRVNINSHNITLPIAALEYLWCCSYLFWVMYQEYSETQRLGKSIFDPNKATKTKKALDLLNWSVSNMENHGSDAWPTALPKPTTDDPILSHTKAATELFLAAIGWILHHEMSHVALKHFGLNIHYSVQQEKESDLEATHWILDKSSICLETQKRILGIVTALLAIQLLELPGRTSCYIKSHPPAIERLDYCLGEAKVGDNDTTCAFATVALQFHLSQFGASAELDGASIRDILRTFMIAYVKRES